MTQSVIAYPPSFDQMVRDEIAFINGRRTHQQPARPGVSVASTGAGAPTLDVVGLALSGGGIRSASFCLGVVQALNEHGVLNRIDYLSTVSGGGYFGSALTATMTATKGKFVFGEPTNLSKAADIKDSDAVAHLRNYSNYLIPRGARDVLTGLAIIVRGLIANAALVLPVILLLAAITILLNPNRSDLVANVLGEQLKWLPVMNFGITLLFALLAFPIFLGWALFRSTLPKNKQSEFAAWAPTFAAYYLVLIGLSFFAELQPYFIAGMFDLTDRARGAGNHDQSVLTGFIQWLATIAAPIAAVVTFFRQQLGTFFKSVTADSGIGTKALALAGKAAIWIAGAALPLLIWIGYLYLCYWGTVNDGKPMVAPAPMAVQGTLQISGPGIELRGTVDCRTAPPGTSCVQPAVPPQMPVQQLQRRVSPQAVPPPNEDVAHTPHWLISSAEVVSAAIHARRWLPESVVQRPVTLLYLVVGFLLAGLSYFLAPNANSLHRLYRDRLSKAFLFDPEPDVRPKRRTDTSGVDKGRDFEPLDDLPISALVDRESYFKSGPNTAQMYAPYHLINAALNVQGSDYANRRGRNAEFFLFSPAYVGSPITDYVPTKDMERALALDLPTAMAISGAAFSSNMGANSIRALTFTLAMLNIRTGYWLRNPMCFARGIVPRRLRSSNWFLWAEITGRLYEDSTDIYVTDGGHIENLGVYELLRRRCRFIVVVDAEADPAMSFPSFITLQRYARIDLGARINLKWNMIRTQTTVMMGQGARQAGTAPPQRACGPHAAIGTIDYDGGQKGWILYIKSSLTGDENDYVRDYARRYSQFPHETTGDQFFSEEQYEAYRALGFHSAARLLNGQDRIQTACGLKKIDDADADVAEIRKALLGERPTPAAAPAGPRA